MRSFAYHRTMAVLWGVVALRLADAPILPMDPPGLAAVRPHPCPSTARGPARGALAPARNAAWGRERESVLAL